VEAGSGCESSFESIASASFVTSHNVNISSELACSGKPLLFVTSFYSAAVFAHRDGHQ